MAKNQGAVRTTTLTSASMLRCAECGSAAVTEARKFPFGMRVGVTVVCPRCAAISVMDEGQCRQLRTSEWVHIVLEPSGFDLMDERVRVAKGLGIPPYNRV